jgi:two-component system, chemotaxis family, chemotaxis protein CheY
MAYQFLIVDDSSIVRKMMIKTLGMCAIDIGKIIEAENGKVALEALHSNWVDLVFLDINMPVMNGMEFMEKIRVDEDLKDARVVIVSTEGSKDRRARLEELSIAAYLRKPVTPESLSETVRQVLEKGGRHD